MKNLFSSSIGIAIGLLAISITSTAFAGFVCPLLTLQDVQSFIENGAITTDGRTLEKEIGFKPAEQINKLLGDRYYGKIEDLNDKYYQMHQNKTINGQDYMFSIGNVLGKDFAEARDRVKQILLSDADSKTIFNGEYFENDSSEETEAGEKSGGCLYKIADDYSKSLSFKGTFGSIPIPPNLFKSSYETITFILILPPFPE
ncbi:MAG: hypothetical protein K0S27_91 [Gammaproteobacteria bacterium]|jgi:hypothetical protein|nr:hypothetical protein [Gammaproteobacteria bacterium]